MASVSFWFILLGILAMLIYAAILYGIFYAVLIREKAPLKIPLSAAVCISRPFIADSCALHSYPWRFFRIDNEPEQSTIAKTNG